MVEFLLIVGGIVCLGFVLVFIWGAMDQSATISRMEEKLGISEEDKPDV